MADLSDLLGDVYGIEETPIRSQPTPTEPVAAPSWADEARLDGFFAGWTPGPSEEARDEERETVEEVITTWVRDGDDEEPCDLALETWADHVVLPESEPESPALGDHVVLPEPAPLALAHHVVLPDPELRPPADARLPGSGRLDDDLAQALSAALAAAPTAREAVERPVEEAPLPLVPNLAELGAAPLEEPVVEEPARPWQRSDDDLLPARVRRRRFRRR